MMRINPELIDIKEFEKYLQEFNGQEIDYEFIIAWSKKLDLKKHEPVVKMTDDELNTEMEENLAATDTTTDTTTGTTTGTTTDTKNVYFRF